jgi:hypothetical protein
MKVYIVASVLALLFEWPTLAEARELKKQRLAWSELEDRVKGRTVQFVLPDGTHIRGKVLGAQPEGLRIRVNETSNAAAWAKGERMIPAPLLSVLRVKESGKKWRVISTVAAPFIVVGAIAAAAGGLPEPGASGGAAVSAGVFGSFAVGYLLGWSLDKKETEIEIIR